MINTVLIIVAVVAFGLAGKWIEGYLSRVDVLEGRVEDLEKRINLK